MSHQDQNHECCHQGDKECSHHHHHGECHHHHHGDFAHQLLEMADDAWMEVLRDKIKQEIIKSSGDHLDKLAKIVSDSNKERWKHKLADQKGCHDFEDKVAEFFRQ